MDIPPQAISIPFCPLLKQITECLHFPVPIYTFSNISKNNVCVSVATECGPVAYMYVGGEASKVEESCERAAEQAVRSLIRKYNVCVEDFTSYNKRMFERCSRLYRLKRAELERVEKKLPRIVIHEHEYLDIKLSVKHVCLNYMEVLAAVVRHTQALLTQVETLCFGRRTYASWLTITCPKSANGIECVFGDYCDTLADAKQSVAKKAITSLMRLYNFALNDANYRSANYAAILCSLERESYLTVKERVLGIKEPVHPSPLLVEPDCLTPHGVQFQIPSMVSPPPPPVKRKSRPSFGGSAAAGSGAAVPLLNIPCELITVFKRRKIA